MDKSFEQLNKRQQTIVLMWVKLGLPIQFKSNKGWHDDIDPDPEFWNHLPYRLKPVDE